MDKKIMYSFATLALSVHSIALQAKVTQPNIVFIMADDLGWTDLGVTGSDFYETPNIDRLASQGMLFTNAYAAAANSAPSRACFMTGMYTPRHGVFTVNPPDRGDKAKRKLIPIPNNEDVCADLGSGSITAIIVPGNSKIFGIFNSGNDITIEWNKIKCIGEDVILVEI